MKKLFKKDNGETHNFWMSYTDLMSGFLVVFIIISIVMYNQYVASKNKYESLFTTFEGLGPEEIEQKVASMQHELDSMKGADMKNLILEYKAVFVPSEFIKVNFDTIRGSISIATKDHSRFLFATGNANFEPELEAYLNKIGKPLVTKTMSLWKEHNYQNVELRIEGHTDPEGQRDVSGRGSDESFIYNLELSSRRANKVYDYLLDSINLSSEQKLFVKKNMISVGYSFASRVYDGTVNDYSLDAASRRIEFRIISK